jgi:hypothetical protein
MRERRARDDDVAPWREHGWVLLEGLVPAEGIDAAVEDLYLSLPFSLPNPSTRRRPGASRRVSGPDSQQFESKLR